MSVFGGIPPLDEKDNAPTHRFETDTAASSVTKTEGQDGEFTGSDMEEEIEAMARQLTRRSTHFSTSNATNPFFEDNKESALHPDSPSFKVKDWIRSLLAAQRGDPDRFRERTAGVAFKNLSVHGFGSATDYQKDVANAILGVAGLVRKLTKTGLQKVQILNEFTGLVRSGEMLVVLGRPGR
jgi:hypothetical protein